MDEVWRDWGRIVLWLIGLDKDLLDFYDGFGMFRFWQRLGCWMRLIYVLNYVGWIRLFVKIGELKLCLYSRWLTCVYVNAVNVFN